jgi:hypothetical protein
VSGSASELKPIVQEETKFPEGSRIIPISPTSKYVVQAPEGTDGNRLNELAEFLADWWDSDLPFVVITSEIVLVKVGEMDLLMDAIG